MNTVRHGGHSFVHLTCPFIKTSALAGMNIYTTTKPRQDGFTKDAILCRAAQLARHIISSQSGFAGDFFLSIDETGAARLSMPRDFSRRRQEEEQTAHLMSTAVLVAAAAVAQDVAARYIPCSGRVRRRYELRERPSVEMGYQHFSDAEFAGALRLDQNAFVRLLDVLRPALERNVTQGSRNSSGVIEPVVRIAIALRMLTGGSHWDLMANFRVGRTIFSKFFTKR
jgi:hypothetical protein